MFLGLIFLISCRQNDTNCEKCDEEINIEEKTNEDSIIADPDQVHLINDIEAKSDLQITKAPAK